MGGWLSPWCAFFCRCLLRAFRCSCGRPHPNNDFTRRLHALSLGLRVLARIAVFFPFQVARGLRAFCICNRLWLIAGPDFLTHKRHGPSPLTNPTIPFSDLTPCSPPGKHDGSHTREVPGCCSSGLTITRELPGEPHAAVQTACLPSPSTLSLSRSPNLCDRHRCWGDEVMVLTAFVLWLFSLSDLLSDQTV